MNEKQKIIIETLKKVKDEIVDEAFCIFVDNEYVTVFEEIKNNIAGTFCEVIKDCIDDCISEYEAMSDEEV